jgi:hypothetical protein
MGNPRIHRLEGYPCNTDWPRLVQAIKATFAVPKLQSSLQMSRSSSSRRTHSPQGQSLQEETCRFPNETGTSREPPRTTIKKFCSANLNLNCGGAPLLFLSIPSKRCFERRLSASIRNYGYVFVPVVAMKSAPSALSPEGINSSPNL